tara:strand:+ start:1021 stop:1134 length:114 start_codon:yes stop_codon:yes gene_type:complete
MEAYELPASLVMELLEVHMQVEAYKLEEMQKHQNKLG